nr:hypothetical protein [uncultured Desulfobulbus sp.]
MSINNYFLYSELSLAAYADLKTGKPDIDKLKNIGMTLAQSQVFADTWNVVVRYDGMVDYTYIDEFGHEYLGQKNTGLSVTIFENISGEQVVAVRGTELSDLDDIATDVIDILLLGTSEFQGQYAALSAQVQKWIDDGTLRSDFSVCGHSLGGFLATNLALEYSEKISETYIYNAPGVTGVGGNILEAISSALSPDSAINIPDILPISNIVATGDAVSSVGLSISQPIVISVDNKSVLPAHSIVQLTSTLAIYNLFSTITCTDEVDLFSSFMECMSDARVLVIVNDIFQAHADTMQDPVDLALELTAYVNNNGISNLSVTSLSDKSVSMLIVDSKNDNSVIFALNELSCFSISGDQPGYSDIDEEYYSDKYIEDRAKFLYYIAHPNETVSNFDPDIDFVDYRLGISRTVDNGMMSFQDDSQYLFGNLEGELLEGEDEIDHLYGMDGNDTLKVTDHGVSPIIIGYP